MDGGSPAKSWLEKSRTDFFNILIDGQPRLNEKGRRKLKFPAPPNRVFKRHYRIEKDL